MVNEVINPALKANQLPEITVKIGLAYGYALVVLYGKSLEKAHIDIVGSSISLSAKISSIAKANQILLGESIYNILKTSPAAMSILTLSDIFWQFCRLSLLFCILSPIFISIT
jgi:class 3 adenylate cyclase